MTDMILRSSLDAEYDTIRNDTIYDTIRHV